MLCVAELESKLYFWKTYVDVGMELDFDLKKYISPADFEAVGRLSEAAAGCARTDADGFDIFDVSLQTAQVLATEIGIGDNTIMLALLWPYVQTGLISIDQVERDFSAEVAELLRNVEKVKGFAITLQNLKDQAFSNFIISFAHDIRIIIYFIAEQYVRMKNAEFHSNEDVKKRLAQESKAFFAPLAHRLGFYEIKRELEDLSVKYLDPDVYYKIVNDLQQTRSERDEYMEHFVKQLCERIDDIGFPYVVKWRTKSINSIYAKMQNKGIGVDEIFDLFALRIILDVPEKLEKAACWAMFGITSSVYLPNTLRTKDWISKPRPSGYESLHTTVLGPDNHWVEVQIRTKRMDEIAEHGQAAHWRYKGIKSNDEQLNDALLSIRTALEQNRSIDDMVHNLSNELYKDEIFVFDNKDQLHKIPAGARIIDYIINIAPEPDWVELFSGANVNGEFKTLDTTLKNGDRVELVII